MSYATDILEGVQLVLSEVGETATIIRTTRTRDPANPSKTITVENRTTVIGALMGPVSRFDSGTQTVRQVTQWYTDLLSPRDSDGNLLNSLTSITWVTKQGDILELNDGTVYTLMKNEQPRIQGVQAAAFHEVEG